MLATGLCEDKLILICDIRTFLPGKAHKIKQQIILNVPGARELLFFLPKVFTSTIRQRWS